MSAFSANRRRILSLWLPRLPIDRIKRRLLWEKVSGTASVAPDETSNMGGRLSPPLRGRGGEGGNSESSVCGSPPSLTSRTSFARLGPRKGGGDERESHDTPSVVVAKQNNALQIAALDDAAARLGLDACGLRRGKPVNLRWVLLHMIEETARHAGHIDLLRENIDGATGE